MAGGELRERRPAETCDRAEQPRDSGAAHQGSSDHRMMQERGEDRALQEPSASWKGPGSDRPTVRREPPGGGLAVKGDSPQGMKERGYAFITGTTDALLIREGALAHLRSLR